tara:strand:- start:2569 stop:3627 length:1059 start_codon:yes stop_codon:yes gene_type:complete
MTSFNIENRKIGESESAFIIAEIGANHNGNINLALELISVAKKCGVDCVKFQTYTPSECLSEDKEFEYYSKGKKIKESEFDLLNRLALKEKDWKIIKNHCQKEDIIFMTTIQDDVDLDLMMKIGLSSIKKGSDDFNYIPNLINVAKTGLPLILSKGMASEDEVDEVIKTLLPINKKLSIMHCVSVYPAKPELLNLNQIITLKKKYPEIVWGYSDHSIGTHACSVAVALGAKVIEKHFTLDRKMEGPDHWFSSDPDELKQLVDDIRKTEISMGTGIIEVTKDEIKSRQIMRRKIVAKKNIDKGEVLSLDNISFKRSVSGLDVSKWNMIKGCRVNCPIKVNSGITEDKVNLNNE